MAEAFKIEEIEEKVILVGVSEQDGDDAEDSVAELAELVKTAGATVVGTMIQKRELIHPGPPRNKPRKSLPKRSQLSVCLTLRSVGLAVC